MKRRSGIASSRAARVGFHWSRVCAGGRKDEFDVGAREAGLETGELLPVKAKVHHARRDTFDCANSNPPPGRDPGRGAGDGWSLHADFLTPPGFRRGFIYR